MKRETGTNSKATIGGDALGLEVLAEEELAGRARFAVAAGRVGVANDAVSDLDFGHVFADLDDLADDLRNYNQLSRTYE